MLRKLLQAHNRPESCDCARGNEETKKEGAKMDLAMAMGMGLFSLFIGSSAYFFYKVAR
ncbi:MULTISPECIES: hypothetical protein [Paraburkholderia]|uniref:hypothetical protein n=1 Tax=Paraburkholderia TaxID=1822464 RepID=UPI001357D771|nr:MULTISPECIES: hypothetical protein [Paraburkholderia]